METTDPQPLIDAASQGDARALDSLLDRYLPGLHAFVRLRTGRMIRGKESTDDLVQSVCREVLEHVDRFQYGGEAGFKHWLYSTALRKISNRQEFYQAAKRDVRREIDPKPQGDGTQDEASVLACYGTFCTPSRDAMVREELDRIELAFDKMPDAYREVIVLARVVGLSRAEIAKEMDRTEAAVRTLLSRALSQLAQYLDDDEEES